METPVSISVGSRGTLISLIDRELELLHAEKMCCCSSPHTSPNPNPNPNPTHTVFASVPASPSLSSAFRSSSTLWHDLKGLLLLKSPTTTSPHYGSSAAIDPSEASAHETCQVPSPDRRRRRPGGITRQRSSTRQHHPTSDLCSKAESMWWGRSNSTLEGGKKKKKGKNANSDALAKLVRLDREAEDEEVPWHGAEEEEEEEEESEFMVKPMLERFHSYYRRCDSRNRSQMEARVSSAASYRISNANVVDLRCCSSACEATIGASSSSPLPKRSGTSFTRLSTL